MISIVDTHAHIDLPEYDSDRDDVMARALDEGVHAIVAIGFHPKRWRTTADLMRTYPYVVRTVGLHPNVASEWSEDVEAKLVAELSSGHGIVGVGEIGLDYLRNTASREQQMLAFDAQVQRALECHLPIVIHQRNAEADTLAVLRPYAPLSGIMHCFSGNTEFAENCLSLGLHLGVGGIATFPRSTDVRAALAQVPLDRVVLETDAPYLAPQGFRGKRNEPARVVIALDVLADSYGVGREVVAQATTENAERLFGDALRHARQAGQEQSSCA